MIRTLEEAAIIAGNIIRDGFRKQFSIEFKTNKMNLVTEIDKKAESAIINYVQKNFPSHGIIAEESGSTGAKSKYVWVIDPLDGTTNFAHGLPIFSVSVGLMKSGKTICGVIYDVMRDAMYSAEVGSGAFMNGEKIKVNENDDLEEGVIVTGFPYNIRENPDNAIEKFNRFLMNARAVRRLGSAAIDFCYVAEGVFDGFWEVHLNPWDVCAGKLIVEEAGGIVTNFKNEKTDIFSSQMLATNGKVHNKMLEILNMD
ncbi:MAG: inositol monophosphatase [Bacteroidetes bacterium]|nr:inositol monophosphatase [Bacteroidota bacterium]MBU2505652.1 inositol monophosphatase [Bacteroidota bacterium]